MREHADVVIGGELDDTAVHYRQPAFQCRGGVPGRAALSCSKHAGVSFRECLDENKWVSNKGRGNRNVVKLCEEAIKVTSL